MDITNPLPELAQEALSAQPGQPPLLGCWPLYPPVELVHSLGLRPAVLWGLTGVAEGGRGAAHLQPYACSVAHRLADFILGPLGQGLAGFLALNACDTLRNMPELMAAGLAAQGRDLPWFRLHVAQAPRAQTDARAHLAGELEGLTQELERAFDARFSAMEFAASCVLHQRVRSLLRKLDRAVAQGRLAFAALAKAGLLAHWLEPERSLPLLEGLLCQANRAPKAAPGPRVVLTGILPPPDWLCQALDSAGLVVAANDIAALGRGYLTPTPPSADPGEYYSQMFDAHHPCTTLLHTQAGRIAKIVTMAREAGAAGVVFIGEKFCEYEYFDLPDLRRRLEGEGAPLLVLEMEPDGGGQGATLTRLEAFAEMLREGGHD